MNEDDDLPVLTQILRTGNARGEHAGYAPPSAPSFTSSSESVEDLDVRPLDQTLMEDQLVIGNEPHPHIDDYLAPSIDDDADHAPSAGHDAIVDDGALAALDADSFRLPQDHDQAGAAGPTARLDEPHIATDAAHESAIASAARTDIGVSDEAAAPSNPVSAERLAAMASSVRESVLEDLLARIDTELDARIAQTMHAEIETALAQLQGNLRVQLTAALRDVVGRAVDDEMTALVVAVRDPGAT